MSALEPRITALEEKIAALEAKITACTCEEGCDNKDCNGKKSLNTAAWQAKLFGWVNNNPILAAFLGLLILLVLSKIFG